MGGSCLGNVPSQTCAPAGAVRALQLDQTQEAEADLSCVSACSSIHGITARAEALRKGAQLRNSDRTPLDVYAGGSVAIGDDMEALRDRSRPGAALYIGGMGARSKNFYNDIFAKSGYEAEAKIIQDLYLAGDKKAAEAAIPDDYLAKSSLIGPEGFVKERLYALRESGVTSLNVSFAGADAAQRTAQCEKLRNLVDSL